jgi:hypothetical protein
MSLQCCKNLVSDIDTSEFFICINYKKYILVTLLNAGKIEKSTLSHIFSCLVMCKCCYLDENLFGAVSFEHTFMQVTVHVL